MNELSTTDIIEAILFASEAPLPLVKLAQILEISEDATRDELDVLREEKARIGGLQVMEVSGGWQLLTKPEMAPYVFKLREAPRQKLSRAAFEVLAVTAYRQPITRAEIEELRGVDCSRPLTFLLDKKLIQFGGRKDSPGRPWLYETTPQFLDLFGIRSIADLPPLAELAEMNEAGLENQARQLFSRGPMQEMPEELDDSEEGAPSEYSDGQDFEGEKLDIESAIRHATEVIHVAESALDEIEAEDHVEVTQGPTEVAAQVVAPVTDEERQA